jgi:phosphoesterase RecJ-like protein
MNSMAQIARQLQNSDDYLIVGHSIPDGDCVGSLLGLYLGLTDCGKKVAMALQDAVPERYHYLSGWEEIKRPSELKVIPANIIFLDCADRDRVGDELLALINNPKTVVFNIDHHIQSAPYGEYNYIDPGAAATGEIIFSLLQTMQVQIRPAIADCLYAAIVMDTGGFLNSNTTPTTMHIAASLLEMGANVDQARVRLFESKSRLEVALLGLALKYIEFSDDGRIAWMSLPYEKVKAIDALDFHPEGIINYTRMIDGVEVGILFREIEPGIVKIGFRSKGNTDVASIAALYNGGGHRQAAGARQEGKLEEVRDKVIKSVKDVIS